MSIFKWIWYSVSENCTFLARNTLLPLGFTEAASTADTGIQKKLFDKRNHSKNAENEY